MNWNHSLQKSFPWTPSRKKLCLASGGQTFVTFIFDSGFSWCVCVPVAFVLSRFTELPILPLYGICVGVDVFKVFIGKYLLDKGIWIRRIVD